MAFVVGVIGVAVFGAAVHGNYSDYHSRHSDYHEYGDAALLKQIKNKEEEVRHKVSNVEDLRRRMNEDFNSRVAQLRREKDYMTFYKNLPPANIIQSVKDDMRLELDYAISQDKQELEAINKMIARINELELQAKRE